MPEEGMISQEAVQDYIANAKPSDAAEELLLSEARRMLARSDEALALKSLQSSDPSSNRFDEQNAAAVAQALKRARELLELGAFEAAETTLEKELVGSDQRGRADVIKTLVRVREVQNQQAKRGSQKSPVPPETRAQVVSWRNLVLKELREALCQNTAKYRDEVGALKRNGNLLIAAVAGYVAASINVTVAVIAALVAAVLRLALTMGTSVFCEWTKSELAANA